MALLTICGSKWEILKILEEILEKYQFSIDLPNSFFKILVKYCTYKVAGHPESFGMVQVEYEPYNYDTIKNKPMIPQIKTQSLL